MVSERASNGGGGGGGLASLNLPTAAAAAAERAYAYHLARTRAMRAQPHGGATKKKQKQKQKHFNVTSHAGERREESESSSSNRRVCETGTGMSPLCPFRFAQLCVAAKKTNDTINLHCLFTCLCMHAAMLLLLLLYLLLSLSLDQIIYLFPTDTPTSLSHSILCSQICDRLGLRPCDRCYGETPPSPSSLSRFLQHISFCFILF